MDILVIEPFYGGSHAQLIKVLASDHLICSKLKVYTLPAKKWHWKARTSALHFMQAVPQSTSYRVLFSSSVLNLAELVALRPDLAGLWKVVYFHENQLVYPVRKHQDRDFHYGYCQITSCLVADEIVFNSEFNKESFLKSISSHLKLIPDHRPKNLESIIRPKCRVIYFPVDFRRECITDEKHSDDSTHALSSTLQHRNSDNKISIKDDLKHDEIDRPSASSIHALSSVLPQTNSENNINITDNLHCNEVDKQSDLTDVTDHVSAYADLESNSIFERKNNDNTTDLPPELSSSIPTRSDSCLHIVWPHRWEHDKDPDTFFQALFQLLDEGYHFRVSVLGESYQEIPEIFNVAKTRLCNRIMAWGFQDLERYRAILDSAHVAVSTANHEFFGVSMLEAAISGCFPLCPKRLVYPEIYPDECLYSTPTQLVKRLKSFCRRPDKIPTPNINFERFSWKSLRTSYYEILKCLE